MRTQAPPTLDDVRRPSESLVVDTLTEAWWWRLSPVVSWRGASAAEPAALRTVEAHGGGSAGAEDVSFALALPAVSDWGASPGAQWESWFVNCSSSDATVGAVLLARGTAAPAATLLQSALPT